MTVAAPPLNIRASLRAEIEHPLEQDFERREKDGVPHANNPKNVRLALFRLGYFAAREQFHHIDKVHLVQKVDETVTIKPVTPQVIADLRFDIHRGYGFLPSKALVKDVLTDVARAFDVRWTQERGAHLV